MSNLQIFNDARFGEIRSIMQGEEVLFVAADVCRALEIGNSRQAITRLDEDEKADVILNDGSQNRKMNVVNEYGLYNLVLASRKPEAKQFKRWITHEVIPAIRKTGGYRSTISSLKAREIEARLNNSRARIASEFRKIAEKTDVPEYKRICQQKAAEALAGVPLLPMEEAKERTYSATDIGNLLGVSAKKIGALASKYQMKKPEYGKLFYDKSPYSAKEVETFRYYANAIEEFRKLLAAEKTVQAVASQSEEEFVKGGVR